MKKFCPDKILTNFQIKSPHYNGGGVQTMNVELLLPVSCI